MVETEESLRDKMQMLKSSSAEISSSGPPFFYNTLEGPSFDLPVSERVIYPQLLASLGHDLPRRPPGIPPIHPFSHSASPSPASAALSRPPFGGSNFIPLPSSHSRSLSQPSYFSLDSLSAFTSLPFTDPSKASPQPNLPASSSDVTMEYCPSPLAPIQHAKTSPGRTVIDEITPRKAHRRSQSDIPFTAFQSPVIPPGLPPLPQHFAGFHDRSALAARVSPSLGSAKLHDQFLQKEIEWNSGPKSEEAPGDDLISAYMNLDSLDSLNSSGTEEKRDDLDRSENEAESSFDGSVTVETKEKSKASTIKAHRHGRSVSMDSFMGTLNFADEPPKLPPSPGARPGHHLRCGSMDGTTSAFGLELGNGEFTMAELNKIMSNDKLAEMASTDPKRVKRILANRQSAARSKERKMRYISELEHKVQTLQTEATTLSAQLTLLQRDSAGLASQNNQLKFRLQAMVQQAKLRDALNEALSTELKRLKLSSREATMPASFMFQLQQQQPCEPASLGELQFLEERRDADAVEDEMRQ